MEPASKRQLRPTASLPTTAEVYGNKFGLSEDLQARLSNVGRQKRLGRFPHSKLPTRVRAYKGIAVTQGHSIAQSGGSGAQTGFLTDSEARANAQQIMSKEQLKARELQPYSQTVDGLSLSPRGGGGREEKRRLRFTEGEDGDIEVLEDWETSPSRSRSKAQPYARPTLKASTKRRSSPQQPDEDEGEATETEDDPLDASVPGMSFASVDHDFPPVFKTPSLTLPELHHAHPAEKPTQQPPVNRLLKGLPGRRGLGKTMSAPVGKLGGGGRWGGGMDVDMEEEEDGFSVSDWAGKEDF
ncbi:hypothetical protein P7C73_g4589, partial [Tremellales sp. Uapishka_1]